MKRFLLHAPNVHTGGGLVLLKDLLRVPDLPLAWFSVDARAVDRLEIPAGAKVRPVQPSVRDRLAAELSLRNVARAGDFVICFHGMPPLLRSAGRVIVFLQNRNYLAVNGLSEFSGRTRLRIALERMVCKIFRGNVDEYLVQTPSMARLVASWHGGNPTVHVTPFLDQERRYPAFREGGAPRYDFVYVADGEAHKNHRVLLEAWILLAREGVRPALALTLGPRHRRLMGDIESARSLHSLAVENLGEIDRDAVITLYSDSRALIYPSTSESFAIPLIEAMSVGLPILASELDYVRDVARPVQTFDPSSPVSIARAVKRFLGIDEPNIKIASASEFVDFLKRA